MSTKPFLKWPGGKFRLAARISEALGPGKRLIEPFVGTGAVFLNTRYDRYLLADNNSDLINLYGLLHQEGEDFIETIRGFFQPECNIAEAYYAFRSVFNNTDDKRLRAALFVYLNRHCYNGLCRYNSKGGFNTPFGKYSKPLFPEEAMRAFVIKSEQARFTVADFRKTMDKARVNDVVYCDPPYTPLSKTANFTDYSTGGFGWEQQLQLAEKAEQLASRGVRVVISNHNTPEICKLYGKAELIKFKVQRFISQNTQNRGKADEIIAIFSSEST